MDSLDEHRLQTSTIVGLPAETLAIPMELSAAECRALVARLMKPEAPNATLRAAVTRYWTRIEISHP